MNISDILNMPINKCKCWKCVRSCRHRPCWGTIQDMKNLIDLNLANRLMLEWWDDGDDRPVFLLVPALIGYGGRVAPHNPIGTCNFLNEKDLCDIHKNKPILGKIINHEIEDNGMHNVIAESWRCEDGSKLIKQWRKLTDCYDYPDTETPSFFF